MVTPERAVYLLELVEKYVLQDATNNRFGVPGRICCLQNATNFAGMVAFKSHVRIYCIQAFSTMGI